MFKEEAEVVVGMFHARWIGIDQCQAPTGQIFIAAQNNHLNHLIPDFVALTRMPSMIWVPTLLLLLSYGDVSGARSGFLRPILPSANASLTALASSP